VGDAGNRKRQHELRVGGRLAEAMNEADGCSFRAELSEEDTLADVTLVDPSGAEPNRPVQVVRAPLDEEYWQARNHERNASAKLTRALRNAAKTGVAVILSPHAYAEKVDKLPVGCVADVLRLVDLAGAERLSSWHDMELHRQAPALNTLFISANCQPLGDGEPAFVSVGQGSAWLSREGTAIAEAVAKKDGKYGPAESAALTLAVHGAWTVTDEQIADFAEKARGRRFRLGAIWVVPDAGTVQRVWPPTG